MKKTFYLFTTLSILSIFTFLACSKDENIEKNTFEKSNAISLIQKDLLNKKYYNGEPNKYDYSSKNYVKYINRNQNIFNNNHLNSANKETALSLDEIKESVKDFYYDKGYSNNEIEDLFNLNLNNINQFSNYEELLTANVENGIIPQEEKEIIELYLEYYFSITNYSEFCEITTTFTHYVNNSNFSEFEKRGMLTIFDTFKENFNQSQINNRSFSFSNQIKNNSNNSYSKVDKDTECGGRMLIGMIGGGLAGNGIGFIVGTAGAFFENWVAGCFD